jgi:hypothetical protein
MLKIVEIHLSPSACGEYVVLQNQGLQTVSLRGWAVCTDHYLCGGLDEAVREMYVFHEDVRIKPYTRVVLFTGEGQSGWHPTTDGKQAYLVYWGRSAPAWGKSDYLHVLQLTSSRKIVTPEQMMAPQG